MNRAVLRTQDANDVFMNLKPLNNIEILLVEDNEMNTLLASAIIGGTGAKVTEANNGRTAIELLRSRKFDLVLLDLHLPVMDGFETARYIRNQLSLNIPIIAITANVINREECRCIEAGMNGFISKPYSESELVNTIVRCISPLTSGSHTELSCPASSAHALYDLSYLESVCKGNLDLLKKMLRVFVEQTPLAVSEIKLARDKHDFNTIYAVAHRIKPDIDNLNIISLKEEIRKIEVCAMQKQNGAVLQALILNLDQTITQVVRDLKTKMLSEQQ